MLTLKLYCGTILKKINILFHLFFSLKFLSPLSGTSVPFSLFVLCISVSPFEKTSLLARNDKGQGKATGINITVGKKIVLHSLGKCDCWRMQSLEKKKEKVRKLRKMLPLES